MSECHRITLQVAVLRLNRDIKSALQMADQQSVDRRQYLQSYLRTYRATPHGTTGRSPSELLHGRQMRTDLDSAVAPRKVAAPETPPCDNGSAESSAR